MFDTMDEQDGKRDHAQSEEELEVEIPVDGEEGEGQDAVEGILFSEWR